MRFAFFSSKKCWKHLLGTEGALLLKLGLLFLLELLVDLSALAGLVAVVLSL